MPSSTTLVFVALTRPDVLARLGLVQHHLVLWLHTDYFTGWAQSPWPSLSWPKCFFFLIGHESMTNTAYSLYTIWACTIIRPYTVIRGTGRQSIASIVFLCTKILPFLVSICLFPICVLDLWKAPVILLSYDTYPRFRDTGLILNSWIWYSLLKIEGFCHLPIVVSATKNVCCGVRTWTSLVGKFEKKKILVGKSTVWFV